MDGGVSVRNVTNSDPALGKFCAVPSKGGSPLRFPNRFPKIRSWKMPYPTRKEVLPSLNGSQASPSRGSKSL